MRSATKVLSYLSAQRNFPIADMYSFNTGGDTAATVLTDIRTSRRVARSFVSRPEWSIPRPSRSPIPVPEHRRCSGTIREAMERIRRGHWANLPKLAHSAAGHSDEIRNVDRKHSNRAPSYETIHASHWTFLRYLFKSASALNRPQCCSLRDKQRCMGAIAPTRSGKQESYQ